MATINNDVDINKKIAKIVKSTDCVIESSKMPGKADEMYIRLVLMAKDISVITGIEGANMSRLKEKYNADIHLPGILATNQVVSIIGSLDNCIDVVKELLPHTTRVQYSTNQHCEREINVLVHTNTVGSILGKGGATIKGIREGTNTKMKVHKECFASSNERLIAIGAKAEEDIVSALKKILSIVQSSSNKYTYVPADRESNVVDKKVSIQGTPGDENSVDGISREGHNRYSETGNNVDQPSSYHQTKYSAHKYFESDSNHDLPTDCNQVGDNTCNRSSEDYHQAGYSTHNRYNESNRDQPNDYGQGGYRTHNRDSETGYYYPERCTPHKTYSETGSNRDQTTGYSSHYNDQDKSRIREYNSDHHPESGINRDHPSDYHHSRSNTLNRYNESNHNQPDDYGQGGYRAHHRDREIDINRDHHNEFRQIEYNTHKIFSDSGSNREQLFYSAIKDRDFLLDTQAGYSTNRYTKLGGNSDLLPATYTQLSTTYTTYKQPRTHRDSETYNNREHTSDFPQIGYNNYNTYRDMETGNSHDSFSNSNHPGHNTTHRDSEIDNNYKNPSESRRGYDTQITSNYTNYKQLNTHTDSETYTNHENTSDFPQIGYNNYSTYRDIETGNRHDSFSNLNRAGHNTCRESEIDSNYKNPSDFEVDFHGNRDNETSGKSEHISSLKDTCITQQENETDSNCEVPSPFLQAATETKLKVSNYMCGAIIGKGGIRIREIRNTSGAKIIFSESNKQIQQDRTITITGTQEQVQSAERLMMQATCNRN